MHDMSSTWYSGFRFSHGWVTGSFKTCQKCGIMNSCKWKAGYYTCINGLPLWFEANDAWYVQHLELGLPVLSWVGDREFEDVSVLWECEHLRV